ncbi:MAG: cobalt ECF transporter T component CbiQ [Spirochaetaceae bacterium]|nr:cobalt ECF transporter T component CbiQ [Spirochaetaceae bacterium]
MNLRNASAGIDSLERLALEDSPIHRLHPRAKLIVTGVYIAAAVSFRSDNLSGLTAFLLYPAALTALSGTPYKPLLIRLLAALPFPLMGGGANLLLMRDAAFSLGAVSVTAGMLSFASIMLKTLLTVFAALILISTTSFIEIAHQLTSLGLPRVVSLQLILTYRYISVLLDEAGSMFTAYILRCPDQKGVKMADMGSFLGQLILRGFDRAERVYQAMLCRGFSGEYRGKAVRRFRFWDYAYLAGMTAGIFILRFFNLSLFFASLLRQ